MEKKWTPLEIKERKYTSEEGVDLYVADLRLADKAVGLCHVQSSDQCGLGGVSRDVAKSYAHILRAAPDLVEALEAVIRVADRQTVEFDMARAALAKAYGKEQPK